jgi:cold shock protein
VGRGNDYREPRRRGFDDDDFAPRRGGFSPPPRPARLPSGPPVVATVKWFNAEKAFGFAELADGSGDAFLHAAVLERSGHPVGLEPGTTLKVRVGPGHKGPHITEVIEVDQSTARPPAARRSAPGGAPHQASRAPAGDAVQMTGDVKWYNPDKGFGFVAVEGGGKDVFVHATVLQRSGVASLAAGQRVTLDVAAGRKGPEAVAVRLAD